MSGPCCVELGVKQNYQAKGNVEQIAGVNTYKIGQSKSAIVIFTDVFGYSFINTQRLADVFSENTGGTTVLIPDYFHNDPIDPNVPDLFSVLPDWLKKHPPTDAIQIGRQFISTIKGHYQSIQVIGFCYGAKVVVDLIIHNELSSTIKAAAVAHPSFLVKEEAEQIKRPILFLCAESDFTFTDDLRKEFEQVLTSNGLGKFLHYPGTTHGFVVRPEDEPNVLQQRDKAVQDAIQYFQSNFE